jgi:hypothetical protein
VTGPPHALFRRWVHVREEDEPGVRVYRPADAPIPPARGRDGIEFRPDGTVVAYSPGPADAPLGTAGRWSTEGGPAGGQHLLAVDAGDGAQARFEVLSVDADVLRLRLRQ